MIRSLSRLFPVAFAAAQLAAQVTGVPGINDYTLNTFTSGSQSCTPLCFPSPTTLTMAISTTPGAAAMVFWMNCPCTACGTPWPSNFCVPTIPNGTISGCTGTNQSIDIPLFSGCAVVFNSVLIANAAGQASLTITVPLLSAGTVPCSAASSFSTQAVVLDPCGVGGFPVGPGPFVLTQAYDVGF